MDEIGVGEKRGVMGVVGEEGRIGDRGRVVGCYGGGK